jgi:hypothetical protein
MTRGEHPLHRDQQPRTLGTGRSYATNIRYEKPTDQTWRHGT